MSDAALSHDTGSIRPELLTEIYTHTHARTHARTQARRCEVTYIWRDYPKHFIEMQYHGCRVAVSGLYLIHGGEG